MSNQIAVINHDPDALAKHVEWELLDPALEISPLSSDELRRLMGFDSVALVYGSPPCAHFAQRPTTPDEAQP